MSALLAMVCSLLGASFSLVGPGETELQVRDRAEEAPAVKSLSPLDVVIYHERTGLTEQLTFRPDAEAPDGLGLATDVWFRGTGRAVNAAGIVVIEAIQVDLRVCARTTMERSADVAGGAQAVVRRGRARYFLRTAPEGRGAGLHVTLVDFDGRHVAEFNMGADWAALGQQRLVSGLAAEVFGLLTAASKPGGAKGAEDDEATCKPTYDEAREDCIAQCDAGGRTVCKFGYVCDTKTGAVAVSCECCPPNPHAAEQPEQGAAPSSGAINVP